MTSSIREKTSTNGPCLGLLFRQFAVLLWVVFLFGCGSAANPLVGKWEGVDSFGQTMRLEFQENGRLSLEIVRGDESFRKGGTYQTDFSQKPEHLDLMLEDRDPVHTIVEVLDTDRIAFENINSSDPRPTQFGGNRISMTRLNK